MRNTRRWSSRSSPPDNGPRRRGRRPRCSPPCAPPRWRRSRPHRTTWWCRRGLGGVPCLTVTPRDSDPNGTIVFVHGGGYIWMRAHTHLAVAAALVTRERLSLRERRLPPCAGGTPTRRPSTTWSRSTAAARRRRSACSHRLRGRFRGRRPRDRRVGRAPRRRRRPSRRGREHLAVDVPRGHRGVGRPGRRPDRQRHRTADDGRRLPRGCRSPVTHRVAAVRRPPRAPAPAGPGRDTRSLLDDARRVVERAREHGVDVTLHEFDDVVHMWVVIGP